MNGTTPVVTVGIASLNQGEYIEDALDSVFSQQVAVEVFVADGGSTDATTEILQKWSPKLAGWRSRDDGGQSQAINECVRRGTAPYVYWLNSDDLLFPGGLKALLAALVDTEAPMSFGRAWDLDEAGDPLGEVATAPFSVPLFSRRCTISQPAALIRRDCWERVGGLAEDLQYAMDYDLWWRLFRLQGAPAYTEAVVAANRIHSGSKSSRHPFQHYRESVRVVREYGDLPALKRYVYHPLSVGVRSVLSKLEREEP